MQIFYKLQKVIVTYCKLCECEVEKVLTCHTNLNILVQRQIRDVLQRKKENVARSSERRVCFRLTTWSLLLQILKINCTHPQWPYIAVGIELEDRTQAPDHGIANHNKCNKLTFCEPKLIMGLE